MRRSLFFIFITVICSNMHAALCSTELDVIQAQIKKTEQQNKKIEQQLLTSDRDVERTRKKLVKKADQVSDLEEQRNQIAKVIADIDAQLKKINSELDKSFDNISESTSSILYIAMNPNFDTDTMHDYVITSALLSSAADRFDEDIQTATKKKEKLDKLKTERSIEKEKLDRSAKRYSNEKNELDKLLKTRAAQNEKLKKQQLEIQKKLQSLSAKAKTISELSAGVGSSEMSENSKFSRRKLRTPVKGSLVVKYGEKTAFGLKSDGWRIRTRKDALVTAPADGVIKFADSFRGFGKIIIMSHKNGYNTVMTNMGTIDALVGQEVLAGEPIGRMDASKSEMYLEVRRGNKSVDPANLFNEP